MSWGPLNIVPNRTIRKKIGKKLRYFRLPLNLAHRKLYMSSSSSQGVLSFTQRFSNLVKMAVPSRREEFCCGFCEGWKLVSTNFDQIQVKQIILRMLEDSKQKKRENRGKKTLTIFACRYVVCSTCCWNAMNSFAPGLRLAFCLQILAYFDEFYQETHVCLSLTRYCDGNLKASL